MLKLKIKNKTYSIEFAIYFMNIILYPSVYFKIPICENRFWRVRQLNDQLKDIQKNIIQENYRENTNILHIQVGSFMSLKNNSC